MLDLGALSRKISNQSLMMIGCFIAVIYFTILSVSTHSWQIIAAQLLQEAFVAIVMGNGLSYFTDLLPDSPGMSATIYSNGSTIGRIVGNLGGGIIAQFAGFRHVNWVCLVLVIFAFLILWRIRTQQEMEVTAGHSQSV
ncbi:MFS transporter [Bacillus sp. X1(2014)]|uniref:MFS transporter n=1 Tax=Bacillus sp. X1(2014) TaxID=1565991 RepID=UPI0021B47062|nr:MFS transporter [Bacillus sp. X1(2014)]